MRTKEKLSKEEKREKKEEKKERKDRVAFFQNQYLEDLLPIPAWDRKFNVGIMEDGTWIEFLGVTQKNLTGASQDSVNYYNSCWDRLYKTYADDLKQIHSVFPTDVSKQLEYVNYMLSKQQHPTYLALLETKKAELEWLAENRHEKASALCFFAKDYEDYKDKYRQIMSLMQGLVYDMEPAKKLALIRLLNNKTLAL